MNDRCFSKSGSQPSAPSSTTVPIALTMPAFLDAPWHQPRRRFAYRVNRQDFKELEQYQFPEYDWCQHDFSVNDEFMRTTVAYSLARGSQETSPFLHCCASLDKAVEWLSKAQATGDRKKECGYIVRIDLSKVGFENIIDLSTEHLRDNYFSKGANGYTDIVKNTTMPFAARHSGRKS